MENERKKQRRCDKENERKKQSRCDERKEKRCTNLIPSYVAKPYDLNGATTGTYRVRLETSPKWVKLGQQPIIEDLETKPTKNKYPLRSKCHYKAQ